MNDAAPFASGPFSVSRPKIDPRRGGAFKPDGTPDDPDRVETGPTALAFAEWAAAGLEIPDLPRMRAHRRARLVAGLEARDYAGVLLYDPLSIRYATDSPNMQLWGAHSPFRACLVLADGWITLFDYGPRYAFLSAHNPLVSEVRGGAGVFYFNTAERTEEKAAAFAAEIDAILRERCGGDRRLAVDRPPLALVRALDALGVETRDGEEVMERVRAVKGPDEIRAMRCGVHACERAVEEMREAARPGATEVDVWAEMQAGNHRRGGEWIETRILSSGPRTNPWFQECGPRTIRPNEVLAWDSDMIGVWGMCVDISRTWWIGDAAPPDDLKRLHATAFDFIRANERLVRPGATFRELTFGGAQLGPEFLANRYCRFHGVGLCDEWPLIRQPVDWEADGYDGVLEPGMCLCVEVYMGAEGGPYGVKLEDQLLVTEDGFENLTACPYDPALNG